MRAEDKLINELLTLSGCEPILKESQEEWYWTYGSFDDYLSKYGLSWVLANADQGSVWYPLIDAAQYKVALDEFMRYGKLIRFPVKKIEDWVHILMKNSAIFENIRPLFGEEEYVPVEEVFGALYGYDTDYDTFVASINGKEIYVPSYGRVTVEEGDDLSIMMYMLQVNGIYDSLKLPDGSADAWSDTQSYTDYMYQVDEISTPEEALVLINKVLDVYHQRSDLASLFITGGRDSLTKISNG